MHSQWKQPFAKQPTMNPLIFCVVPNAATRAPCSVWPPPDNSRITKMSAVDLIMKLVNSLVGTRNKKQCLQPWIAMNTKHCCEGKNQGPACSSHTKCTLQSNSRHPKQHHRHWATPHALSAKRSQIYSCTRVVAAPLELPMQ